ncbi:MAG: UDP-N-acetylglucosamine 2-epimerase [bacterium]|nr:UDP-N-acetylglucosamine 2-epimerase [bacterium]
MKSKRKICFVITSKIHYSRSKLVLRALRKRADIDLQIVVAASALLDMHGNVLETLANEGFYVNDRIIMTLEGSNTVAMSKTTGIGIIEFTTAFDNLRPDVVVARGDRYEVLSAAVAASFLNIPIAHIEGGDISGTIDESVRHAITKLSHIHFPTNEYSAERIVRMGEDRRYVFNVGSCDVEFVAQNNFHVSKKLINYLGVGDVIDIDKPFLMVMQHPVTSEVGANRQNIEETLHAIYALKMPTIWFWPNVDAGADEVSKGIRAFREEKDPSHMRFLKSLPAEHFIGLLKRAACLLGNSSAGIKECSYLGTPVVNIGTRQHGRLRAENVIDADYDAKDIARAVKRQLRHGRYEPSKIYYQPGTSGKIAQTLAKAALYTQKCFVD